MSTDDGKATAETYVRVLLVLRDQRDELLAFAQDIAIGAYVEHEAKQRAKQIVAEVLR